MVGESNQNVFLIQKDTSSFAEFGISEFEIARVDCICSTVLPLFQLGTIESHQKAISELITIAEKLRWENKVKGQQRIEQLLETRNDLENVTVTLKTTAEMITDQGSNVFDGRYIVIYVVPL